MIRCEWLYFHIYEVLNNSQDNTFKFERITLNLAVYVDTIWSTVSWCPKFYTSQQNIHVKW